MTSDRFNAWFKAAPRPLMAWVTVPLIPYLAVVESTALGPILMFAGALYGIREAGKLIREDSVDKNTG